METFEISGLSFSYPGQSVKALDELSLTVAQGEFLVICGPSGCGKSTLLRMLKTVLAPHGERTGSILFEGRALDALDQREQSQRIGFVQQSPENQIVTDKVWHELAFGLESLGLDTPSIRRRVAEMASFFGIETWFYKNVTELSGGQKQLLNLAAVMVMQPSVLILDEPTSQLDPIAASEFLSVLKKINRELGTTVLLTEHRLEEALSIAGQVAVMDRGRVIFKGTASDAGRYLKSENSAIFLSMPTAMRIWAAVDDGDECPVTVRQGRDWLEVYLKTHEAHPLPAERLHACSDEIAVSCEDVWFRYEKDLPDVVKGLDLKVKKGEFVAILGGNGTGKTTSIKLIASLLSPYRGEIRCSGSVGVLPQNPQSLFVKKTVREDLFEIFRGRGIAPEERDKRAARIVRLCRLEELLDRHPYDLSGGEQQRAALAKVLLLDPDILLMDEPTKGFDADFKQLFAEILRTLIRSGRTILMVSHDVEFCAEHAHRCALFFDGNIVNEGTPRAFFSGNSFYTTAANRMSRGMIDGAVTAEDIIAVCGGAPQLAEKLPDDDFVLPPPAPETPDWKPEKLPVWRRVLAWISGLAAVALFIQAMRVTDLKSLVDMNGLTDAAPIQFGLYAALIAALAVFAVSVSRRTKTQSAAKLPSGERRLSKRTAAAAAAILLLIPLTLFVGVHYLNGAKYYFIALLILLECMAPFFLIFEGRKPQARELVIIAVLCAIGVAGRAAFFMLPYFKPVLAVVIISGVAFGGETGFLVGAVTMLVSNIMFSQGPWTPWQMFAAGIIGFIAGVLFRKGLLRRTRAALAIFGALVTVVLYGGIMNPAAALMYLHTIDWKILLTYYMTGVPVDLVHAAATAFFLWFAAEPMLEKLDRVKTKYGLVE